MLRTFLCPACMSFVEVSRRDALNAMRAHAIASTHPLTRCIDVDSTFARIVGVSYGVRA